MKNYINFSAFCLFSLLKIVLSQKTCEEIIKLKIDEEQMIPEIENNMLEIKKNSDKYLFFISFLVII
jgi:hypothetical protein